MRREHTADSIRLRGAFQTSGMFDGLWMMGIPQGWVLNWEKCMKTCAVVFQYTELFMFNALCKRAGKIAPILFF